MIVDDKKDQSTRNITMIAANDINSTIDAVDDIILPKCVMYDEFDEGHPVYRIGDYGYIDATEFESVISSFGIPWLLNAYIFVGNGLSVDDVVDAINGGDETLDSLMSTVDDDRLDDVYYTEC